MRPSSVAAAGELSARGRSIATAAGEFPFSNRSRACITTLSPACARTAVAYSSDATDPMRVRAIIATSVQLKSAPGIHAGAAPRGDEGGNGGDDEEQHGSTGQHDGITRRDAVQDLRHAAWHRQREPKSGQDADARGSQARPHHERNQVRPSGAERAANSHFARAPGDGVRDDAEDSRGREETRDNAE